MRLVVCENPSDMIAGGEAWSSLSQRTRDLRADVLLLNEMPFGSWVAGSPDPDNEVLAESRRLHDTGLRRFDELGARYVLSTRPTEEFGVSVNEAFVWHNGNIEGVHTKQYFPQEEGYYEASWFQGGDPHFRLCQVGGIKVGFLICTEIMFNERARHYGRMGAQIIAMPRAVGFESLHRWKVALSMAAIVSGCYVISSNRSGVDNRGQRFGGAGWIFDPEGDLIAETSAESPVVTARFEADRVVRAQKSYPCYVEESDS